MHVIVIYKYEKKRTKNRREKVLTPFFPILTLSVTMDTGGCFWQNFKLIQALLLVIPLVSQIFMFESKYTDGRRLGLVYYKLTSEPSAQVS